MKDLPFDPTTLTKEQLRGGGGGVGISSKVVHITRTSVVAKIAAPQDLEDQKSEKRVYERLQNHPDILRYLGQNPPACKVLGDALFEYHRHGTIIDCLRRNIPGRSRFVHANHSHARTTDEIRSWPFQAVSATEYIHSKGVVHGGPGLHNFLLHDDGRLILCDFAGSGLDDLPPNVSAGVRYFNPLFDTDYPQQRDGVHALGTVLYELDRGERLFEGKSDPDTSKCLRNKQFPDLCLASPPPREVIEKCWTVPDYTASDALIELDEHMAPS
jgi:serine/threonine protein kinase